MKEKYDVVILGGGPAGLASAIAILQKSELSVLVVEGQPAEYERIGESCPPDIILLLKQLGLSNAFNADKHARCPGYASVWGKAEAGYNDFIVNPLGPSWRLNRRQFDRMLANSALHHGAEIMRSLKFIQAQAEQNGYSLRLMNTIDKSTHCIHADFVVDATGHSARFAKSIGIKTAIDDQLFAKVRFANIENGNISKQVHIEATENGWWYNTLLPENRMVSMMVTEKENLPALRDNNHQGFTTALASTTFVGRALQGVTLKNNSYHTWPIYSGVLSTLEGKNWMAIGDAASSYDPIVAQGIYKGLTDGIQSAKKVVSFFKQDQEENDTFSAQVKQRYHVYQRNRAHIYALEQRWPRNSFWSNRYLKILSAIKTQMTTES